MKKCEHQHLEWADGLTQRCKDCGETSESVSPAPQLTIDVAMHRRREVAEHLKQAVAAPQEVDARNIKNDAD